MHSGKWGGLRFAQDIFPNLLEDKKWLTKKQMIKLCEDKCAGVSGMDAVISKMKGKDSHIMSDHIYKEKKKYNELEILS